LRKGRSEGRFGDALEAFWGAIGYKVNDIPRSPFALVPAQKTERARGAIWVAKSPTWRGFWAR
jgi:hypothetical protein